MMVVWLFHPSDDRYLMPPNTTAPTAGECIVNTFENPGTKGYGKIT
jgi:hypothetical protein